MKAAHWNGQRLALDPAYPTPQADAQTALVRVHLAGICSTDLQILQGYMGFMLLWLAKHPELIDPMNDYKRASYNPMSLPVVDNGFAVVTKDNADDFYWDAYLKRRGTKGIEE